MISRLQTIAVAVAMFALPLIAQAFSIRPATLDVQAKAGQPASTKFAIINSTNQTQTYYLSSIAFAVKDDSDTPVFDAQNENGTASWLQFSSPSVTVPDNGQSEVTVLVDPTNGTPPGEYYVAALVSATPAPVVSTINGASVQADIAELIFVDVGGTNQVKIGLLDFSVQGGSTLRSGLWGSYTYRLQNQGTVHVVPQGMISVHDLFGQTIAEAAANPNQSRILPGTTRVFEGNLAVAPPQTFLQAVQAEATHFALGPVTLQLTLMPGLVANQPLQSSLRLWIFPWQLIVVIVLGVAVLYGLMKMLMRSRKT